MATTTAATTALPPFQPDAMTAAQLAAVSCLARYTGHTHELYAAALRRWLGWCRTNDLDPLAGIQRRTSRSASATCTSRGYATPR